MRPRTRTALALTLLAGALFVLLGITGSARLDRAELVINNGTEVSSLDPATITGIPEGRVMRFIFEGLVVKHPKTLAPVPGMAKSWETSADGRSYVFHLRDDAVWTNGEPVTAHDFEWSWQRLLHPLTAAEYAYQLWYVRGAREYSLLPIDREYLADPEQPFWFQRRADGSYRIGLIATCLSGLAPEDPLDISLPAGSLAAGQTLVRLGEDAFALPVELASATLNPALSPLVGPLRKDPYEAAWLAEVRVAEAELERLRDAGTLLDPERFRARILWPQVGIDAVDDHTLEVELIQPTPFFLDLCGYYPLYPVNRSNIEEAQARWPESWQVEWVRPENIVTNGPYRVAERRVNDRIRMVKFDAYWDADNVALETVDILAVEHYGTMLNLYLTGEVDWIDRIPSNLVPRLLEREDFQPAPYLGTYFFRVNVRRPPLDDARVRRALALTIDRRAICEKIVKSGQLLNWALVPHGIPGYELQDMPHAPVGRNLAGYDTAFAADCAEARALIAEAGFGPDGKPLRTLELLYNTSEAHRDIAEVIADGWKRNLGLDVKLQNQEWKVYLDSQKTGSYDLCRSAWIGDYPDPNTFLDLFLTGGENNRTGWGDPRYDQLIHAAALEADEVRRIELLQQAEALLMQELPLLPVFTYATQNMWKPRLGGFAENILDQHFPKFFYWMDDAELAAKRAAQPADQVLVDPGGPPTRVAPGPNGPLREAR